MSLPGERPAVDRGRHHVMAAEPTVVLSPEVAATTEHIGDPNGSREHGRVPEPPTWQSALGRRLLHKPGRALLAGLLVAAMAGVLTGEKLSKGPTTWTSQTVMIFDDPLGIAIAGDAGELAKLSEVRYKYASLAGTEAMAQPVAAELKVPVSTVLASTSTVVPVDSVLLDVDGTASTPAFARELSTAMAREVVSYIQTEDSTYAVPNSNRFLATIVSPATAGTPQGPSKTRALSVAMVAALAGFLVGFAAYQLVLAPTRRRSLR